MVGALTAAAAMLLLTAGACRAVGDDGTVVLSGDIPGLDSIALRADSLLAPSRDQFVLDSLRRETDLQMRRAMDSGTVAGTIDPAFPASTGSGGTITARAHARGDSMARAEARGIIAGSDAVARARRDTVRGVVALIGDATAPQLVLHQREGDIDIALSGMATTGMSRLVGTEIMVRGFKVAPRDVVVSDYVVRAVNGVPAFDGILDQVDGAWGLTLTDGTGRKRLPVVPPMLRSLPGLRVWVSLRAGTDTPDGYGLIRR